MKKKRRGSPDKYREYMRRYMVQWRANRKIKEKPSEEKRQETPEKVLDQ